MRKIYKLPLVLIVTGFLSVLPFTNNTYAKDANPTPCTTACPYTVTVSEVTKDSTDHLQANVTVTNKSDTPTGYKVTVEYKYKNHKKGEEKIGQDTVDFGTVAPNYSATKTSRLQHMLVRGDVKDICTAFTVVTNTNTPTPTTPADTPTTPGNNPTTPGASVNTSATANHLPKTGNSLQLMSIISAALLFSTIAIKVIRNRIKKS